ncbi:MAG: hypothetical protein J6N21_01425 [Butyrivibrio sp.]|nr:hypothetical protein [Butyrivibrio sp.]
MIFEWTSLNNVTSDIVDKFDCGEETFNDFLKEQAKTWMSEGYAVTYVAVDKNELEAVTLNANDTGLGLYKKFGFIQSDQYIPPDEEEKIDIENCTPLIFSFMDVNALVTLFS